MAQNPWSKPVDVELETLIRARYPIIYVVSWEERRVEETLREICQKRGKKMIQWTITSGLGGNVASRDPLAALDQVLAAPDQTVFLLKDFHPFMNDHMVVRKLRDLVYALKTSYKTLVLLSPVLKLPVELEKEITVVDYQLPSPQDLDRLLEGIIQSVRSNNQIDVTLSPLEREQVLKAASGLTSNEAENVFAKSLVEKRKFDIDVILSEKEQIIRKSGILEYYPASEAFSDVGGMDLLKEWMSQRTASFTDKAREYGLPEPKGVLLLGVQGCGKSLTAKAIGSLWKLPLLRLDVGKIFGGIVGQSEENIRKAISTAESVAPCVTGDTRITLWGGAEKTIQELYDGQETELTVQGMDANFQAAPVHVTAITRREAPDLFTIKMRHATLQATSNHLHPVLRAGKLVWVRTDALDVGDAVAVDGLRFPDAENLTPSLLPEKFGNVSDILWTRVDSVEQAPTPEFVYDLCCEGTHNFVANGVYTHNCILWIDELEKGFSGTQSSGSSDGGTTSRVFGTFLAWMQDKKAPVFVIATSNDVTALPPELLRKGRFDEIFFVDLPSKAERKEIFDIHLKKRGRDPKNFDTDRLGKVSVGFSGAEIEQAVVSALFAAFADRKKDEKTGEENIREVTVEDMTRAVKISVPLSVTMQESIAHLRMWAEERARPVSSVQSESAEEIVANEEDDEDAPRAFAMADDEAH